MPWIVGIDEAGYGPNLGPLVQAAVAAKTPDPRICLWKRLADHVRRATDPDDGRLLIDDSKLVHTGADKLARLERGVTGLLTESRQIGPLFNDVGCATSRSDLDEERWFDPDERLPVAIDSPVDVRSECAANDVEICEVRCLVTPAARINALIDRWNSKAAALEQGVTQLLRHIVKSCEEDNSITIVIDKQGGRNFYAAWLGSAFPDCWVRPIQESALVSEYELLGADCEVRLIFRPKAESESMPVALASMLAKYLREVLMRQFNRFWIGLVPGLKPTAGYPGDAKRFYNSIRPAMKKLQLQPDQVWRKR